MSDELKDTFKGHGSMIDFVDTCNALFAAHNNGVVEMPSGYAGRIPTLKIECGKLVLNMKDAQVFSPARLKWVLNDNSTSPRVVTFDSKSATVINGYLTIKVNATAT